MFGGGVVVMRAENPLLAPTVQQVVRLAQSISGATLRAHILVMMAEALTD